MFQMFGQMMWMPLSMLTCWMNLLASAMQAMQPPGQHGQVAANRYGNAPGTGSPETGSYRDNNQRAQRDGATKEAKEERKMSDCCCHDHDHREVKLVEYTIVSIKRCDEKILYKGQIVYSDDMSDEAFATWVIARWLQGEDGDPKPEEKEKRGKERREAIKDDDKKYLRVYHHVLESWARPEKDCCQDREVNVLKDIEKAIRELSGSRPAPAPA